MKANLNEIILRNKCDRRGFFDSLGLESRKGRNYYLAVAAKTAVDKRNSDVDIIKAELPKGMYILDQAEDKAVEVLSIKVKRYLNYIRDLNIIQRKRVIDVDIHGKIVPVVVDNIIEHEEFIEVTALKTGKTYLSYGARKEENKPENDIGLYFLYQAGLTLPESIRKGKPVIASYHYLTAKNDTLSEIGSTFNEKRGHNIISCNEFSDEIEQKVKEIMKTESDLSNAEECDGCDNCPYSSICFLERHEAMDLEIVEEMQDKAGEGFSVTPDQRKAILFDEGIARINAGAGSGKTTVISLRIVELIQGGANPEDILLITFTNKGAQEMRDKIAFWLDKEGMDYIDKSKFNIMTFNAWGAEILKSNFGKLGYTEEPELIERVQKYDIIINLLKNYDGTLESFNYNNPLLRFFNGRGVVVELEQVFDFIKGHYLQDAKDFREKGHYAIHSNKDDDNNNSKVRDDYDRVYELYELYIEELKKRNLIEYQDQVNHAVELANYYPEELEGFNYQHIIVDEFQDSDKQQLDLVMFLSQQDRFKSLMVVGDDSQSIFGFRNTSQEIILNFDEYFYGVVDINITENFRSTGEILGLANAINDINVNKLDKDLVSGGKTGSRPTLIQYSRNEEEYEDIAVRIKEDISNGVPAEEVAVLGRTKAELTKINEELKKLQVPSIIDIPEPFINNLNLHVLQAIASYLGDTNITSEFFKYIYAIEGEYLKSLDKEQTQNYIKQASLIIDSYIYEGIETVISDEKNEEEEEKEVVELTEDEVSIINDRKLELFFLLSKNIKDEDIEEFIEELEGRFKIFSNLNDYLNKFILYEDPRSVVTDDVRYKAVTLTTAHSSKGREWEKVYLTLNRFSAGGGRDVVEEERRLLFVALTRAKQDLVVTAKEFINKSKGTKNRYLRELESTGLMDVIHMAADEK